MLNDKSLWPQIYAKISEKNNYIILVQKLHNLSPKSCNYIQKDTTFHHQKLFFLRKKLETNFVIQLIKLMWPNWLIKSLLYENCIVQHEKKYDFHFCWCILYCPSMTFQEKIFELFVFVCLESKNSIDYCYTFWHIFLV